MKKTDNTHLLFNLNLFSRQKYELLTMLDHQLATDASPTSPLMTIFTPNPEQIVQAQSNPLFAKALGFGSLLLPDGVGLVFASRLLALFGKAEPIAQRISGIEVVEELLARLRGSSVPILIVGGRNLQPYVDAQQREGLNLSWLEAYEQATIATKQEEQALTAALMQLRPQVVFVALGAPEQELWVANHRSQLERAGVRLVMVVGGSFDMLSGKVPRAPHWMRQTHLEWLFRLLTQPWRWKRQLRLIQFVGMTLLELFKPTTR